PDRKTPPSTPAWSNLPQENGGPSYRPECGRFRCDGERNRSSWRAPPGHPEVGPTRHRRDLAWATREANSFHPLRYDLARFRAKVEMASLANLGRWQKEKLLHIILGNLMAALAQTKLVNIQNTCV